MRLPTYQSIMLLILLIVACGVSHVTAEDDLSNDEAAATFAWAKEAFAKIDCRSSANSAKRLQTHSGSLLRWSNPAIGRIYGDVFLWTRGNRPAALVSIYEWHSPYTDRTVEFLSLLDEPMTATIGGKIVWRPSASELRWTAFEPRTVPASTAQTRLIQMRRLAARFQMVLDDRRNDDRGETQALRELTRPVFRYDCAETGLIDGGLFAFVSGTDPEAFLLLEARENPETGASWYYALARMNTDALSVKLDGTVVERFRNVRKHLFDPTRPYSVTHWPHQRNDRQASVLDLRGER
jgi:hypothetical protein